MVTGAGSVIVGGQDDSYRRHRGGEKERTLADTGTPERALQPEDLDRLFLRRANAGDVDGVVALYEPHAVLAVPPGQLAIGSAAIRAVYADLLAGRPRFTGEIRPAIRNGDLAITSTTRAGDATVEVARRQPDGTWLWMIDQPSVLG
jgi:ketosteroid isomerase-like protein